MADLTHRSNGNNGSERERIASLAQFLEAMQQRYRTELGEAEYLDWLQTLKSYPLAEVIDAANELLLNPPAEWSGMPKLPDVIRQMFRERERKAEEHQRHGGWVLATYSCETCGGTGWVEGQKTEGGNRAVKRCQCSLNRLQELRS